MVESGILMRRAISWCDREKVHCIVDHLLPQLEFSRPLDLSDIPAEGFSRALRATSEECEALCRRFDLEELRALVANIHIEHARGPKGEPALRLKAAICAEVMQVCVVTLKQFRTNLEETFTIQFQFGVEQEKVISEDDFGKDTTEFLETSKIDPGELVAQHLALALDPHPRAPGALWQGLGDGPSATNMAPITDGPFAKLGQLKHKM